MRAFFRHDHNLLATKRVMASVAKQSPRHCEAQRHKQFLFRYVPQARPRLHACTTSATDDLRPAPYEEKSNRSAGSLQGVAWLRAA